MKKPHITLKTMLGVAILAIVNFSPVQAEDSAAKATTGKPPKVYILAGQSNIDLSGEWLFRLDPQDVGRSEEWFNDKLTDKIQIPGVLQEQGYGSIPNFNTPWVVKSDPIKRMKNYPNWFKHPMFEKYRDQSSFTFPYWLQPKRHYLGVAWYQKSVSLSQEWMGKKVVLHLERCRWLSELWINGKYIGKNDSLGTPHEYDVSNFLKAGPNVISLRIDGSIIINLGEHAHSVGDQTQMTWNGIIGKVQLSLKSSDIIQDIQAFPNMKSNAVEFHLKLNNKLLKEKYTLKISGRSENSSENVTVQPNLIPLDPMDEVVRVVLPLGSDFLKWDEHNPNLYRFNFDVISEDNGDLVEHRSLRTGIREIEARKGQFYLNGESIYLRGTLNCAEFPLKGYPDMDVESWRRIFRACKAYGLNHVRFHSWCPPEAAFIAADELGVYLQAEVSEWAYIHEPEQIEFLIRESKRMLETYGNHPSFVFMGLGNEDGVAPSHREDFINEWKTDTRRLYTLKANSNTSFTDSYDYQIAYRLGNQKIRIQAGWLPKPNGSIIVEQPPNTLYDYSDITGIRNFPIIAHETVQRCVFPNPDDISKFSGNLQPGYLKIARDQLRERGLTNLVPEFVNASGKWQVQQFKDEIEAHLRTEPFGGFQLLSLQDFPGQGTALVGVLDLFWESKGYVSGDEFKEFCSDTVPLVILGKRTYENTEKLGGTAKISYYGEFKEPTVRASIHLLNESKQTIKTIDLGDLILGRGLNDIGSFEFDLEPVETGKKLTVVLECEGQVKASNSWNVWQFPKIERNLDMGGVLIAEELTPKIIQQLEGGASVLFLPKLESIKGDIPQCFSSMYWNCPWTNGGESHTLGLLINNSHPVFKWFPTDDHTDWQWWDLLTKARPMILDEWQEKNPWPKSYVPIIQPIDGWNLNRKLSLLAECKVGKGKLMVSGIDFASKIEERNEARALLKGILSYMNSNDFNPESFIQPDVIFGMLNKNSTDK